MAGKNWKRGYLPTHERYTPVEQVASLLQHVDRDRALMLARTNAAKKETLLNTYPRSASNGPTFRGIAHALNFWRDVAAYLARPGEALLIMDEESEITDEQWAMLEGRG